VTELYFGPFDNGSAIPAGTTPDWINPHDCDYNNFAFNVVKTSGGKVNITLTARNHGNVDVADVTVNLFGGAAVIDWTADVPAQLRNLVGSLSLIKTWPGVTLPARPSPPIEVNPWNSGQTLWPVPPDYGGKYVLIATMIHSPDVAPGPVPGNDPCDPSRDRYCAIWVYQKHT